MGGAACGAGELEYLLICAFHFPVAARLPTTTMAGSLSFLVLFGILVQVVLSQSTCSNFGSQNGTACACPPGFGGSDCSVAACGGNLFQGLARPLASSSGGHSNISTCPCQDGWIGEGCGVCQSSTACQAAYTAVLGSPDASTSASGVDASLQCNTAARVYASGEMSCQVIVSDTMFSYRGS